VLRFVSFHRIAIGLVASGLSMLVIGACPSWAQLEHPRVFDRITPRDTGTVPDSVLKVARFYIDKGLEAGIGRGDRLNVYREKRVTKQTPRGLRLMIGRMLITDSQNGVSVGVFEPSAETLAHPLIRVKTAMKGDIVVPRVALESSIMFTPGSANLTAAAGTEFDKVAASVKNFSPAKVIIEGHTDSDGDATTNLLLSQARADAVANYLVTKNDFISAEMVEAHGYGATRPVASNDTPENKLLNRRIEVIVWD